MRYAACTAFRDDGETTCDNLAICTEVTVQAGGREFTRLVCGECRRRMDLPDHDVTLTPGAGSINPTVTTVLN